MFGSRAAFFLSPLYDVCHGATREQLVCKRFHRAAAVFQSGRVLALAYVSKNSLQLKTKLIESAANGNRQLTMINNISVCASLHTFMFLMLSLREITVCLRRAQGSRRRWLKLDRMAGKLHTLLDSDSES